MGDRTTDYVNHMKAHFTGHQEDQPLMTFEDNTSTNFGVTTGNKIKAKGWAKIGDLLFNQGTMTSVDIPVAPFVLWVADLTLVFKYQGWTHGEKWLYPGGAFVDNVWDSVSPAGTITLHLKYVPGANGLMAVSVTVEPGNDDRPNRFVTDIVRRMAGTAAELTHGFTGQACSVSQV